MNYRILYFFHSKTAAVLASGFTKEAEVPKGEIDEAVSRKTKFLANPTKHTYTGATTPHKENKR